MRSCAMQPESSPRSRYATREKPAQQPRPDTANNKSVKFSKNKTYQTVGTGTLQPLL